jgi:hypothetical protein
VEGKPGCWLITHRGGRLLKGEIAVPLKVQTFRNKVLGHSEAQVNILEFRREEPFFEKIPEFDVMHLGPRS